MRKQKHKQKTVPAQTATSNPTSPYPPQIEKRRVEYERLCDALIAMMRAEYELPSGMLDVEGPDLYVNAPHLSQAITAHLFALHQEIGWWHPATLRRFYVDMRLWADQRRFELERDAELSKKPAK